MGYLIGLLLTTAVVGGVLLNRWYRQEQIERFRDRARLRVIEGQLATLRAALRIGAAEHLARRQVMVLRMADPFANSTGHEEYHPDHEIWTRS